MRPLGTWPKGTYSALAVLLLVSAALGVYMYIRTPAPLPTAEPSRPISTKPVPEHTVIGTSVEGRSIDAYMFQTELASSPSFSRKGSQEYEAVDESVTGSRENSLAETAVISREGTRGLFRGKPVADETKKHIVFVGGIHGGYEWNSVALGYKVLEYLTDNPGLIPPGTKVTIIPNLNPDAVHTGLGLKGPFSEDDAQHALSQLGKRYTQAEITEVLEKARFNADSVDLNRNFACSWQAKSTWKSKQVSAGKAVFSEPEAQALKTFVEKQLTTYAPAELSFVFWHSQANAVYASRCKEKGSQSAAGTLPGTTALMNAYASAAGYKAVATFDAYPVTGAAEDWLSSLGIPAITVELSSHKSLDWDKNKKGVDSVLGGM